MNIKNYNDYIFLNSCVCMLCVINCDFVHGHLIVMKISKNPCCLFLLHFYYSRLCMHSIMFWSSMGGFPYWYRGEIALKDWNFWFYVHGYPSMVGRDKWGCHMIHGKPQQFQETIQNVSNFYLFYLFYLYP